MPRGWGGGPYGVSPAQMGVIRRRLSFPSSAQMGDAQLSAPEQAPSRAQATSGGWPGFALPSPPHYLRAAVRGPEAWCSSSPPAGAARRRWRRRRQRRQPGGRGRSARLEPLSSPGREGGPYLGPPRLGPRAARGRGMAPRSSNVPTSGERASGGRQAAAVLGGAEGEERGDGRWGRLAGGRRRWRQRGDGSRFPGAGGGKGKGNEGRGGEVGREPPPRARAGRRRRRCRSAHSSLFGGTLFVSHNALRGRRGWEGEGEVGGANGLGGGAPRVGGARGGTNAVLAQAQKERLAVAET